MITIDNEGGKMHSIPRFGLYCLQVGMVERRLCGSNTFKAIILLMERSFNLVVLRVSMFVKGESKFLYKLYNFKEKCKITFCKPLFRKYVNR